MGTGQAFGRRTSQVPVVSIARADDEDSEPTDPTEQPPPQRLLRRRERSVIIEADSRGRRPKPFRWWAQVLALPLLVVVAAVVWLIVVRIQDDVEEAAEQILVDAGIDTSDLRFDARFRDVEVSGRLPAGVSAASVELLLESETGSNGRDIRDATIIAEATALTGPVDVQVGANGRSIVLDGQVPRRSDLEELVDGAASAGVAVTNNITVSGTEPESADHIALIQELAGVIGLLDESVTDARVALDDGSLSGMIQVSDAGIASRLRELPSIESGRIVLMAVGNLDAEITYDGSRIVLDGKVLSDAQSTALIAAAERGVGAASVIDNLMVLGLDESVPGADRKVDALADLLTVFDNLLIADVELTDRSLAIDGQALDPTELEPVDEALAEAADAGLAIARDIGLVHEFTLQEEIDLLQAELDDLRDRIREDVRFAPNSDDLDDAAKATLDEVAAAMDRYTRPVVEIGGHTDSRGDPGVNQILSAQRARSVATYLVESGIIDSRLNPVGYGESQPLADNIDEAGREANRRVEFTARESF